MHTIEDMLVEKNYSRCPLKKRPVNYQFDAEDSKPVSENKIVVEQPENLSLKKEATNTINSSPDKDATTIIEDINVSDCCEDEGVDVDHRSEDDEDEEIDCEDEDEEMIDCVDIGVEEKTTQAAALAAAAAAAAATAVTASALIVPTPTYPKYGLQPWNFHISPYTAEFYRTINNPHLAAAAATPLRGELLSPSSPSDSIGSLSPPPPHYLHGRASSVSPPMRAEIIHRPIGVRHLPQSPTTQHQHRFMPYPALPAYPPNPHHHPHHHHHSHQPTYPLSYHPAIPHHHAPISPAYSESSYYSMRSLTPESNCSSLPEDLSVKHSSGLTIKSTSSLMCENVLHTVDSNVSLAAKVSSSSGSTNQSSSKKDKNAPPRYQCPDCQKSYSTFSGLTKHQQFHCPAAEGNQVKKSFSCKDCEKTYVSLGALKMHIRTHTLPCKCNICGKAFSRPWLLQGHIRTHTGEKPFSCQHCHRAFADRSNLRAHLQTHSDIKKYSCTNCSKTFSRMSLLTKHSEGGCPGGNVSSSSCNTSNVAEMSSYVVYAEH